MTPGPRQPVQATALDNGETAAALGKRGLDKSGKVRSVAAASKLSQSTGQQAEPCHWQASGASEGQTHSSQDADETDHGSWVNIPAMDQHRRRAGPALCRRDSVLRQCLQKTQLSLQEDQKCSMPRAGCSHRAPIEVSVGRRHCSLLHKPTLSYRRRCLSCRDSDVMFTCN